MESVLKSRQKSSVATKKEYVTESFVDEDGFTGVFISAFKNGMF